MINSFSIQGEIYKEPQYNKSAKGTSVVKLTLSQGKNYFQFVAFKEVAEDIVKLNLVKGDVVSIESKIQPNNYEKNGQKVYGFNFIIETINIDEKAESMDDDDIPTSTYEDEPVYNNTSYLD